MSSKDYQDYFVPNGAVYLSTVGYGTGALLGRGVEAVEAVHWREELGLAQAHVGDQGEKDGAVYCRVRTAPAPVYSDARMLRSLPIWKKI